MQKNASGKKEKTKSEGVFVGTADVGDKSRKGSLKRTASGEKRRRKSEVFEEVTASV